MDTWKEELRQLKFAYLKRTAPDFFALSGGERMKVKPWRDDTTNGLTNAVCDWLKFSGHYSNRINSQGQMRKINGEMKYTHGSSNLGTADIDSIIDAKPVKIEIKCAWDQRPDEKRPTQRAKAGGSCRRHLHHHPGYAAVC